MNSINDLCVCPEEMDVVGHKHISVDGLAIALWSFFQPAEVGAVMLPVVEHRLAISLRR